MNTSQIHKYRPDIDGLRAIAVLSVVLYHAFPSLIKGGFIGVDIFFVISGFLISKIIFENLASNTFSFSEFYIRRVKRIFPALLTVLLFCLIFGWLTLLPNELNQLGKHIGAGATFISNFVLWSEVGYFDAQAETKPLLHLWSLGIEEQFYIIWPLLLWFMWKKKINLLYVIILGIICSFLLNVTYVEINPSTTFYLPHTRFWELLAGALLAWGHIHFNFKKIENNHLLLIKNISSIIGLSIIILGLCIIETGKDFPGFWAVLPVLGAVLMICASTDAWINQKILSNKIMVWFGLISFPLYLWHWPLLVFAQIYRGKEIHRDQGIIIVCISILLAWLTVKFIEYPFRFNTKNLKQKIIFLVSLMVAIGISGFCIGQMDLSQTHSKENIVIKRKDLEHLYGSSSNSFEGKNNWFFLGNAHDKTIAKAKLSITPSHEEIQKFKALFINISIEAQKRNIKVVLVIPPNKSTVYSEYLPNDFHLSPKRYIDFFIEELKGIPNLTIYDPKNDLLMNKKDGEYLYWTTDSHWNAKGAFVAYEGLSKLMGLPVPEVSFKKAPPFLGDLVKIHGYSSNIILQEDNWEVVWKNAPTLIETKIETEKTPFGQPSIVQNSNALINQSVWVIGDSFAASLKPYFYATFENTYNMGHWSEQLSTLPSSIIHADKAPDIIVIERIERSF